MKVYFKNRKLYFRESCSEISNLLEWDSEDDVQTLLFVDEEGLYTYDGLYKLLKDKVNLELENPYSIDQRVSVSNDFLDNITLFDFQTNAISKCLTLKRGVVDSVTGSGKTELIIGCLRYLLDKNLITNGLVIVPSVGLATQLQERAFKRGFSKEEIGVIGGGIKELKAKIKVSVVNSLYNGVKKYRNGEENALFDIISTADFLALDEGHHSSAESWSSIILEAKKIKYALAFSGSPFSEDDILDSYEDSMIYGLFNGVIVKIPSEIPMKLGLIATPLLHFHTIRAKKLHKYRGMWHHVYKTFVVKNFQRNNIIKEYTRKFTYLGFQSLILVTQLEHAKILMQLLKNFSPIGVFGGSLGLFIDPKSGLIENYSLDYNVFRENLSKGYHKIVIGSPCLDEGFDMPSVGLVIMAGAQKSKKKIIQRLGRGLRRKSEGSNQVYVLDFNDLTHVYLSSQSKKRNKIYTELGVIKKSHEEFIREAIAHNKFKEEKSD